MARGELRIYLGAAPGVGKTYAMLDEAHRRVGRGTEVVVGAIDTHGRPATAAQLVGLRDVRGHPLDEGGVALDLAALLERRPHLVLVDELATSDVVDGAAQPRWRAVAQLLDAGIDVISTIDIGQLESLGEIVQQITGVPHGELVPDGAIRGADQIQLVDQTPEALRRRLAHGNIFPAEQLDAERANAFRPASLAALRELSLSWMADRVEEGLERVRVGHAVDGRWETREAVVVALTGAPSGEYLIRRAGRLADRSRARLLGVHVRSVDGGAGHAATEDLEHQRRLVVSLGGTYREVASGDVAGALIEVAVAEGATQLVVGSSGRSRWVQLTRGSLISDVLHRSPLDVHVIAPQRAGSASASAPTAPTAMSTWARSPEVTSVGHSDDSDGSPLSDAVFSPRRRRWAWAVAIIGPVIIAAALGQLHDHIGLSTQLLMMVLGVTVAAGVGGARPALIAAIESFLLANWFFTPPVHQLSISASEDAVALAVFLVVAIAVGGYVSASGRRPAEALRATTDASTLAAIAGTVASAPDPLPVLVERMRAVYGAAGATLMAAGSSGWTLLASAGVDAPDLDDAEQTLPVGADGRLLLAGGPFRAVDSGTTAAFLDQLSVAVEQHRLRASEEMALGVASANDLRAALLAAVSHDLRTPLASIKAAVSSLRLPDVEFPDGVREELLESIETGADRLTGLVTNLLDMSRIQAEAVDLHIESVRLDEIVHRAAIGLDTRGAEVTFDLDDRLPGVDADGALLEHVVANLVDNACKWSPTGGQVRVDAQQVSDAVHLRVIDRGPGIPVELRQSVLMSFRRGGDAASVEGTGLGLAVASGFARLMGVNLVLDDTPGGGTTATLIIPLSGTARSTGA